MGLERDGNDEKYDGRPDGPVLANDAESEFLSGVSRSLWISDWHRSIGIAPGISLDQAIIHPCLLTRSPSNQSGRPRLPRTNQVKG
jgi:hypothetical protein